MNAGAGESRSFAPHRLVAGERPQGGAVFDRDGQRIGVIGDVAIDEATGKVAYAILRYGGFLGVGRRCRPVPWSLLAYDPRNGGYVTVLDRLAVEGGPTFGTDILEAKDDAAYREKVHGYYADHGAAPYWT
jgi:hypothetical protein